MIRRAAAITICFLFILFVNVAASLSAAPKGITHPMAGTVTFFQTITNIVFTALLVWMMVQAVRKFARQMVRIENKAQDVYETYPFVDAPLNPNSPGWRIVDTSPMPPITDQQVDPTANGTRFYPLQQPGTQQFQQWNGRR